jgi:transcriptional regulator with XRE-family HTH domain
MSLDYNKIRVIRVRLGKSQEECAKQAGLGTRQRWSNLETGKIQNIKLDTLERIAGALGVKSRDLLK